MLKIKDSVDLKELEKFGFKYTNKFPYWWENEVKNSWGETITIIIDNGRDITITHEKEKQIFRINDCVFDLIKADLVEKVGDKE